MEAPSVSDEEELRALKLRLEALLPPLADADAAAHRLRRFEHAALNLRRFGSRRHDPVQSMLAHVGNFWTNAILCTLEMGPLRPSTLQKLIVAIVPDSLISGRMLTLNLRGLEADGLIERDVRDRRNPHVEYRLTVLGEELCANINAIVDWGVKRHADIVAARQRYEPPTAARRQRGWRVPCGD